MMAVGEVVVVVAAGAATLAEGETEECLHLVITTVTATVRGGHRGGGLGELVMIKHNSHVYDAQRIWRYSFEFRYWFLIV